MYKRRIRPDDIIIPLTEIEKLLYNGDYKEDSIGGIPLSDEELILAKEKFIKEKGITKCPKVKKPKRYSRLGRYS